MSTEVKRYDLTTMPYHEGASMVCVLDGDYVRYEDYEALEKQRGWQPIATAPKDNTRILVCGGTFSTGDHEAMESTGVGIARWRNGCGWLDDSEYDGNEIWREPTLWMPLPAKPDSSSKGAQS